MVKKAKKTVAKKFCLREYATSSKNNLEKQYFRFLDSLLDELYDESDSRGWTWKVLAKRSQLSYGCICAIGNRLVRYPRLFTVVKIGKAVGYEITMDKQEVTVRRRKAS